MGKCHNFNPKIMKIPKSFLKIMKKATLVNNEFTKVLYNKLK